LELGSPQSRVYLRRKPLAYVAIEINEITDADGFKDLLKTSAANFVEVKFTDGRYLARTENITTIDGTAPKAFVLIAFDNVEKAKAATANMKEATALRMRTTKSRAFIVEGLPSR
jgi:uncharacterized protein (DUF1330 family)